MPPISAVAKCTFASSVTRKCSLIECGGRACRLLRLWESKSALLSVGLNQKGKAGLWLIQKAG